jgi:hypothetical protein
MKKVFVLALAFAGLTSVVNAQTGSILVGGNVGLTSTSDKNTSPTTKETIFTFSPTVGYQFSSHWTAGLTADFNADKTDDGTTTKQNSWDLGPFIRYAKPLSDIFSVYGQAQATFGSYKTTSEFGGNTTTTDQGSTVNVTVFPAVFINLKNSFGLNFNVGGLTYAANSPKSGYGEQSTGFNVNFGKVVNIGISKNFGGHRK